MGKWIILGAVVLVIGGLIAFIVINSAGVPAV